MFIFIIHYFLTWYMWGVESELPERKWRTNVSPDPEPHPGTELPLHLLLLLLLLLLFHNYVAFLSFLMTDFLFLQFSPSYWHCCQFWAWWQNQFHGLLILVAFWDLNLCISYLPSKRSEAKCPFEGNQPYSESKWLYNEIKCVVTKCWILLEEEQNKIFSTENFRQKLFDFAPPLLVPFVHSQWDSHEKQICKIIWQILFGK